MLIDKGTHYEIENYDPPPGIYCPRIPKFIVERYKMEEILKRVLDQFRFEVIGPELVDTMTEQISKISGFPISELRLEIMDEWNILLNYDDAPSSRRTLRATFSKTSNYIDVR